MTAVSNLPARWRNDATTLRRRGAADQAVVLEGCADELELELQGLQDELLTIEAAAAESGYSAESLRRMVRDGKLPCERRAGENSRIHVRRGDLPKKQQRHAGGKQGPNLVYDPEEDARDIAKRLGGLNG
jgi:hypothetical protein